MSRDHERLKVFRIADDLVIEVYRATSRLPDAERFALQTQVRRAAVSVAANIVEGCTRSTNRDFAHFLDHALGSASETRYLLTLAARIYQLPDAADLSERYGGLVRGIQSLLGTVRHRSTAASKSGPVVADELTSRQPE